jgi:hypothetical protein
MLDGQGVHRVFLTQGCFIVVLLFLNSLVAEKRRDSCAPALCTVDVLSCNCGLSTWCVRHIDDIDQLHVCGAIYEPEVRLFLHDGTPLRS